MQKVIGLDIGSYSIKAVEIVNTFKSYEITNFYEYRVPHVDGHERDLVIPSALEKLFAENDLQADRIITAMPGQYISSRVLPFNFSNYRQIEAVIGGEVEDRVPFNLDDMVIDHQVLGQMKGQTAVLAVMTRKSFLKSFLEHLQRIDIDPKLIDIDSLSFYNLLPFMELDPEKCVAIVDVGHEKTSLCIVQNNMLRMFRSVNIGGKYLTEFLARDLELSFNEAEQIKHRVSRVLCDEDDGYTLPKLSDGDRQVAERMTLATNTLVKELGRTFYSFKTWEKTPISQIVISGGTSRIQDLDLFLSQQLELPVRKNRLDESDLKISGDLTQNIDVMPQSVAIGVRAVSAVKQHSQINLRKGEFAFVQDYEQVLRQGGSIFRMLAIVTLILGLSYLVQTYFYSKQISELKEAYKTEFVSIFPEFKRRYRSNTASFSKLRRDANKQLRTATGRIQDSIAKFQRQTAGGPAMLALAALSRGIPEDVQIDVTLFQYTARESGGGRVTIKGETDGYASSQSIFEAIREISTFSEVEEKGASGKPGTDNKIIEFTIVGNFDPFTPVRSTP